MSIFQTIKFRIIALAVLLAIGALGLRVIAALPYAQGQLTELVAAQQLSISNYVALDVAHKIDAQRTLIDELANALSPALIRQPDNLASWIKERHRVSPLFNSGLIVLRPDAGTLIAQYPVVPGRDTAFTESDWFKQALTTDKLITSKPQRGPNGQPMLVMAKAIRDSEKHVLAVLVGVATPNAPGFLEGIQKGPNGGSIDFLLISPSDKLFVAASIPSLVFKTTPPVGVNLLHDRAMTGYRGTGITVNARGIEELSAIVSVPTTEWFLVTTIPTSEAFKPIHAMRVFVITGSLVVTTLLVAFLLWALPQILKPLTCASRSMRAMADGTEQLAAIPIKRKDEVGDLVLGFNYLVGRLREKEDALKASEARLQFMAHHDSLTGLYNRAVLEDRLQQALARADRDHTHFAVLFCDLDGFKSINDEYGHEVGDTVLQIVAARLLEGRRRTDTVARLGGDEFVILLTDLDNALEISTSVARQLLAEIAEPIEIDDKDFSPRASIGIALYRGDNISASQLMSQADTAMYQVKRNGKNGVRAFEDPSEPVENLRVVSGR